MVKAEYGLAHAEASDVCVTPATSRNSRRVFRDDDFTLGARLPFAQKRGERHPFVATSLQRAAVLPSFFAVRLAALGAFAAAIAFAGEARSFCRTVTRAPPVDWNPVAQGCFNDSTGGAKALFWKNSCVSYSLQQNASRLFTLEQATAVVAGAFEAWSSAGCSEGGNPSVNAVNLGPVECGKAQYNRDQANQNVIVFHDDEWPHGGSDKTLGLTTVTFDTMTGELVGADMEINATQDLVIGDDVPAGSYSLASVITHEVGHFLGLAHSAEPSAIMSAQYKATASLAADDVQGLCAIYAPNGSRATTDGPVAGVSCDPTPRGGFIAACTPPPGASDPATTDTGGGCSTAPDPRSRGVVAVTTGPLAMAWLALTRRRARAKTTRTRRGARVRAPSASYIAAAPCLIQSRILLIFSVSRGGNSCGIRSPHPAAVWQLKPMQLKVPSILFIK